MLSPLELVYWVANIMHSIYTGGKLEYPDRLDRVHNYCKPVREVIALLFYNRACGGSRYSPFVWFASFHTWTFRNQGPDYWSVRINAEDLQRPLPTFHAFWQTDCDRVRASVKAQPVPVLSFFFGGKDGGGSPGDRETIDMKLN